MEAETMEAPRDNFLHKVRDLCHQNGAIFIIDEIITGFRWHLRGAQFVHDIVPDLCTFGKAMANGFSLAALMGRRDLMELGGLHTDKERVWLLSTTYGAETFSLAAAMEVMRVYQTEPVIERMYAAGERLARGANQVAAELGIEEYFQVLGRPSNLIYATKDQNKERSQPFRTLFMQEIIKRGVIGPSFVISYAHTDEDVDRTVEAVAGALVVYRQALEEGVDKYLVGRPVKPAIRTFN
jgi:glutamate-1-semialdehyde 2,1-aminomutase